MVAVRIVVVRTVAVRIVVVRGVIVNGVPVYAKTLAPATCVALFSPVSPVVRALCVHVACASIAVQPVEAYGLDPNHLPAQYGT